MRAFIKTRAAFRTAYVRNVLSYDLVMDSLENASSTLSLQGEDIRRDVADSFLSVADTLFLIASVSPAAGQTDLVLSSPVELFTRPRPYTPPADGSTVGAFIARELTAWRDEADAVYALPYLQIVNADATSFTPPTVDEQGYYVLTDYLRQVRRDLGVELRFTAEEDRLTAEIRHDPPGSHTLVAGDGHTTLQTNTYDRSAVAKVTTVHPVDTGEVDENGEKIFETVTTDWYLGADGSVSSQEPAGRADGSWEVIPVSAKASAEQAALSTFGKNVETHKVAFWTDFRPRVRDDFRLRLPSGASFAGQILAVSRAMGDRRWLCQAGSLATTLQDKVRKAGASGRSSGSSGSQFYAVGDIFLTTRAGDPAALLGYGAWTRIEGCYLYCASGSAAAGSRGGHEKHTITRDELPSDVNILDPVKMTVYGGGAISGSGNYFLRSTIFDVPTEPMGSGAAMALDPVFFAINVWLRKA